MTSGLHARIGKWSGILLLSPSPPHLLESLFSSCLAFSHALSSCQDGEPKLPRVYKFSFSEINPNQTLHLWPHVCDKHFSLPSKKDAPEMTATDQFRNLPKLPGHQCRINSLFLNIRFMIENNSSRRILIVWKQLKYEHVLFGKNTH